MSMGRFRMNAYLRAILPAFARQPLLHFLLIGAVIGLLYEYPNTS